MSLSMFRGSSRNVTPALLPVGRRYQIMVVDDDSQTRMLLGIILERLGVDVVEAYNADSALQLLDLSIPDLMILDVAMPGMNGLELCRYLRGFAETAQLPIILFTASGSYRVERAAQEAGANDCIAKTNPPQDLSTSVLRLLGARTAGSSQ